MEHAFSARPLPSVDRRVYAVLQAIVLAAGLGYIAFAVHHYLTTGAVVGSDFAFIWSAAQVASPEDLAKAYGGGLFSLDAAVRQWGAPSGQDTFAYPPHALVLLLPLHGLSFGAAFLLWEVFSLAALALAAWAAFNRSGYAALFIVVAPATFFCLWLGQTGMIASALLIAGIGLLERRPLLAGALFGLLTFKPTLGVLIPFALLAGGHWRAIAAACLVALALILASVALYGADAWLLFLTNVPGVQMGFHADEDNLLVNLAPTAFMAARLLGLDGAIGYGLQALLAGAAVLAVLWAFHGQRDFGLKGALLLAGTALASPFVHIYDMSFVTAAILLLLQDMQLRRPQTGETTIALIAWLLPIIVYFFNGVLELPLGPVILVLLVGTILRRLSRAGRDAGPRV